MALPTYSWLQAIKSKQTRDLKKILNLKKGVGIATKSMETSS